MGLIFQNYDVELVHMASP